MVKWAIGSLAAYNALPAAVQAEYAARYDEPAAAWAQFQAIDPLGDDYTWELISDVTLAAWPGGFVDFGNRNFIFTSRVRHYGNPNRGYAINMTGTNVLRFIKNGQFDLGSITFQYLKLYLTGSSHGAPCIEYGNNSIWFGLDYWKLIVTDCMFFGLGAFAASAGIGYADLPYRAGLMNFEITNCKFYNVNYPLSLYCNRSFATIRTLVENCTSYDEYTFFYTQAGKEALNRGNQYITLRNCVISSFLPFNQARAIYIYRGVTDGSDTYINIYNCAQNYGPEVNTDSGNTRQGSFDTIGLTGPPYVSHENVINDIVANDQYLSVDYTNDEFLFLGDRATVGFGLNGSPRIGKRPLEVKFNPLLDVDYLPVGEIAFAGSKPSKALYDIAGVKRGEFTDVYAIGAHEPVWASTFAAQRIDESDVVLG